MSNPIRNVILLTGAIVPVCVVYSCAKGLHFLKKEDPELLEKLFETAVGTEDMLLSDHESNILWKELNVLAITVRGNYYRLKPNEREVLRACLTRENNDIKISNPLKGGDGNSEWRLGIKFVEDGHLAVA